MSFTEFGLDERLMRGVEALGFEEPTAIQQESIPPAMQGRDVIACARTGSGKTAAFMLPILNRLLNGRRGLRALVLTPTRELAAQVESHRAELARFTRLTGATVYGGVSMIPQRKALQRGVDVLVATPGRLLDHMRHPYTDFSRIEVLVLDEVDRMLDMGFLPDIQRILERLPSQRQNLMFSATLPGPISAMAREMLRDPYTISIDRPAAPPAAINHTVYAVPQLLKTAMLLHLLKDEELRSAVVFTRTKHRADRLAHHLVREGVAAMALHGDRTQAQRAEALNGFRRGGFRVLVATDLAARGLDIEALSHVVNFDVPRAAEDYIHRVGRTGRAGAEGEAITLVAPDESGAMRSIERTMGRQMGRIPVPAAVSAMAAPVRLVGEDTPDAAGETAGEAQRPRPAARPERPAATSRPAASANGRQWVPDWKRRKASVTGRGPVKAGRS